MASTRFGIHPNYPHDPMELLELRALDEQRSFWINMEAKSGRNYHTSTFFFLSCKDQLMFLNKLRHDVEHEIKALTNNLSENFI